jgi:multidrug resistance efflux pump
MLNPAAMKELAARKQALVAESELTRQTLRAEFRGLQASLGAVADRVKWARAALKVALLAAPLGGLILARKKGGWRGLARAGLAAWRLLRPLRALWTRA